MNLDQVEEKILEEVEKEKGFNYPLSFNDWMAEFRVGSNAKIDVNTEHLLKELKLETVKKEKELIIRNSQRYCRLNHTTEKL